jgi:hypothetical protein
VLIYVDIYFLCWEWQHMWSKRSSKMKKGCPCIAFKWQLR